MYKEFIIILTNFATAEERNTERPYLFTLKTVNRAGALFIGDSLICCALYFINEPYIANGVRSFIACHIK
jgi:hypothetical protein